MSKEGSAVKVTVARIEGTLAKSLGSAPWDKG